MRGVELGFLEEPEGQEEQEVIFICIEKKPVVI